MREVGSTFGHRVEWIEAAKGIGIVLVVVGHVIRGLVAADVPHDAGLVGIFDFGLYTFHMPLFFFLSGLVVDSGLRRGRVSFLSRRVWTVLYPYILWSLIQGGLMLALASLLNSPPSESLGHSIVFSPIGQFWFLYALMFCHILAVTFMRYRVVIVLICIVMYAGSSYFPGIWGKIAHHAFFYAAGIVCSGILFKDFRNRPIVMISAAAMFAVAVLLVRNFTDDPWSAYVLPAAVLGIAATVFLSKLLCRFRGLRWLGGASMTIFVLHILAGSGARILLNKIGFPPIFLWHLISGVAIALGSGAFAHLLFEKFGLLGWLGLGPMPSLLKRAANKVAE